MNHLSVVADHLIEINVLCLGASNILRPLINLGSSLSLNTAGAIVGGAKLGGRWFEPIEGDITVNELNRRLCQPQLDIDYVPGRPRTVDESNQNIV